MKIMTLFGTRPEIIRLCRVIEKLDGLCRHIVVHTGQNYDVNLNDIFFEQLGVRAPDHYLGAVGSFGEQIARILAESERLLLAEKPDKFLILGDTNSCLAAIMAKRLAIPVYHMEAGNRCYDDRVPEEVNRRIIDHSSDVLMPYTERSRKNLLREGLAGERIYVTGNPIFEVIKHFEPQIDRSAILDALGLQAEGYFLVTMHRAENVDLPDRLERFIAVFDQLQRLYNLPVIISTHPRTRNRLKSLGIENRSPEVRYLDPFGFFGFVALEKNAFCVLSDSGTVQEECAIFRKPNVTIRDVTERPETIECGSNILSGADGDSILLCVKTALNQKGKWNPPPEYLVEDVSTTVTKIILGHLEPRR
ncbi:MAG: UDP-N-acetylglucosamine 2-epimerase (non-hydrolyzing) [Deltaproteobacteria bacterium]|nr:UDP-N-acetylglucosamine 2-epimerase (non-hydrolyzing) [Deltaproteobacteria bacterium]